jgi:hypothetical protein
MLYNVAHCILTIASVFSSSTSSQLPEAPLQYCIPASKGDSGMPVFRNCSTLVIRCFKRVEHFADWITGAAGPVFVFLAWTLIIAGGFVYCELPLIAWRCICDTAITTARGV